MNLLRCGAVLLLLAQGVRAEEPPAPPPAPAGPPASSPAKPTGAALDDRLAAVRTLMKAEKWQAAVAGLRAVFEEFQGSPEVVLRLHAIEEDLKLCTFRAQEKPPTPEQIFGVGTKSYASATRLLVMEFPKGPITPPWEGSPPGQAILRIRFEDVSVDYEGNLPDHIAVSLSYDFDTDNGYELRDGCGSAPTRDRADISRLEAGKGGIKKATVVATCFGVAAPGPHKVRFALKDGELSIVEDGRTLLSAKDSKFPRGLLGIRGMKEGSLAIRGRVEAAQVPALLEACRARRFREWTEKSWKREEAIPEWARKEAK